MRKGFLHIVEIIIVGLMAFLVLLQFSYMPKQEADWASMRLSAEANDLLFSLDRQGVDWFNSTQVGQAISSSVSNNTIYSLKVMNVMKPRIAVGCICSAAERDTLAAILQPFWINGQPVSFSVTRIDPSAIQFSHTYDAIVDFDYNLTGNYTQIRQFLGAGKGIVEFRTLDQSKMDAVQTGLFGMVWDGSMGNNGGGPVQFRSNDSSGTYYNIYKYFHNIPIYLESFSSGSPGWLPQSGTWSVSSQSYAGQTPAPSGDASSLYSKVFNDTYSVNVLFNFESSSDVKVTLLRQDASNYAAVTYGIIGGVNVFDNSSGVPVNKGSSTSYPFAKSAWYYTKIIAQPDGSLRIYVNNTYVMTSQPVTTRQNSQIGLGVIGGPGNSIIFDDVRVTISENHSFSQTLLTAQPAKVQPADGNIQKVILLQKATGLPACIANSNIVGDQGRTAWLTYADPVNNQDVGNMLRALVVWAAGEQNDIITNDVRNVPVVSSIYKTYDQDMFQPAEIVLTLGNTYA